MKKLIIINGPFAGGKSSVIEELSFQKDFFLISFDKIKRFFSHYDRYVHREYVEVIMSRIAEEMMVAGYTIVLESARPSIKDLAVKYGYETDEFNIEASLPTTLIRFRERLNTPKDPKTWLSNAEENKSEDRFIEKHHLYQSTKNKGAITFSSEKLSPREIADRIIKISGI